MNDNWTEEQLGKNAYIKGRIGWRGLKASEYKNDGPFLIAGNHIKNGRVDWSLCDHINIHRYNESWEIALQEKDIILTKDGTIGRIAIIDTLPGPSTINSTMMLIRVRPPLIAEFIYHYLNSASFQKIVEDRVSGSSIPHIFQQDMKRLKTPVPSEIEQRQIATFLDTTNKAIQRTEQLIVKLKSIKQGLLHDLLTRGLDENGQLRNPIAHPEQFKDSQLGKIPNEWEVYPINEIGKIVAGTTPSRVVPSYWGGIIPWITPTDMSKLRTDYISSGQDWLTQKGLDSCSAYLLPVGSIVVTTRATLGLAAITQRELATNQGFKNIIIKDGWDNRFVCYKIQALSNEMVRRASGTTFMEISGTQFSLLEIAAPAPGSNEQDMIASAIAAHNQRITTAQIYLEKLTAIKKGLMHDLLTGKVRVNINKEE